MEEYVEIKNEQDEIYANAVRAGKRTYFFDVRATKGNDYYLTITESKRRANEDGSFSYQKHKLFLYKEDFEKFSEALTDAFKKVIDLKREQEDTMSTHIEAQLNSLSFDDLGND